MGRTDHVAGIILSPTGSRVGGRNGHVPKFKGLEPYAVGPSCLCASDSAQNTIVCVKGGNSPCARLNACRSVSERVVKQDKEVLDSRGFHVLGSYGLAETRES